MNLETFTLFFGWSLGWTSSSRLEQIDPKNQRIKYLANRSESYKARLRSSLYAQLTPFDEEKFLHASP